MFLMKVYAVTGAGNWVTINGTHVLIGGNGKIMKGPAKFIGSTVEDMKNAGKSTEDKKAELKKKLAEKKSGGASKPSDDSSKTSKSTESKEKSSSKSADETVHNGVKITKDSEGRDTFTVDGKTYHYSVRDDGSAYITYDNKDAYFGRETLYGFNSPSTKGFGSAKEAIDRIREENSRMARVDKLEAQASKVGGIALTSSDRIIKPGTVKASGSDSKGVVQYTAESIDGKRVNLTSADMGELLIKGIDARNSKAMSPFSSSSKPTTSSGTKYPSGINTPAQKRAYTRAINSGMTSSEAKKSALGKATKTNSSSMSTFKSGSTTTKKSTGKYTADNIPKVAGASKSVMKKTAEYMNKGDTFNDAFDKALQRSGYGMGSRRGMFR